MSDVVRYPVLEVHLTYAADGALREWIVSECCFHELTTADDRDLAGMGLALMGNLIKTLGRNLYDEALGAVLLLKRHPRDAGLVCPWPGMPDDRPVPLDLTQFPFETAMFLDDDGNGKHRVDRLQLLARIHDVWVPWLHAQLLTAGVC